jgi:hypothetical protein
MPVGNLRFENFHAPFEDFHKSLRQLLADKAGTVQAAAMGLGTAFRNAY